MTKQELIANLVVRTNMTKAEVLHFMSALEQTIHDELTNGGEVSLVSMGKFKVKETKERTGRNPKTGETVLIAARRKVTFTPSKALKDAVI